MPTPPAPHLGQRPGRRSAKQRPLAGVLISAGRREAVVVTALEKRLVINVEADISAIPVARVRRDDGLNLRRTDQKDWQIRFDTLPPPGSWVHDLPLLSPPNPLRRAAVIVLALLGLIAAGLWAAGGKVAVMAQTPVSVPAIPLAGPAIRSA